MKPVEDFVQALRGQVYALRILYVRRLDLTFSFRSSDEVARRSARQLFTRQRIDYLVHFSDAGNRDSTKLCVLVNRALIFREIDTKSLIFRYIASCCHCRSLPIWSMA